MADFAAQLAAWGTEAAQDVQAIFDGTLDELARSVIDGSELTGAPGQPVGKTGRLKRSWKTARPAPDIGEVSTDVEYAPIVEDGEMRLHSPVGGSHSVKLTVAGFDNIVDAVAQRVAGSR